MTKVILLILLSLALTISLYAQNDMPLMQSFEGEYGDSWFGNTTASIDFNADGFDDLVVYTRKAGVNQWAQVNIYYGNTVVDTAPDLILESDFFGHVIDKVILNIGDINGDSYADLMISERFYQAVDDSIALRIFYGGPNADLIPDYTINTPMWSGYPKIMPRSCLGDVNGDGFDDLGIWHWNNHNYPDLAILLGGTFQVITIEPFVVTQRMYSITAAGDINNDGFDDYIAGYATYAQNILTTYRYLYYGGNPLNLNNRILLRELADDGDWNFPGGYGIGDFNGDGFDDFVYCNGDSYRDNNKLRLGGTDILSTPELTLHSHDLQPNLMDMERQGIAYGDFNGDGYSDVAGTDYTVITWTGDAGVWLGRAIPNGQYDLRITTPATSPFHQFGWQVDSGDFNGDGYCDLAISAPQSDSPNPWYNGYVYIFAGNAQLADTTVENNNDTETPELTPIRLSVYPNPSSKGQSGFSCSIEGKLPGSVSQAVLTVHDIKGRTIGRQELSIRQLKQGKGEFTTTTLKPGIYIVSLEINGTKVTSSKVTIR